MGFALAGENISLPVNVSGRCAYSICNKSCQIELIWAECKTGHTETQKACDPRSETCPPTPAPGVTNQVPAPTRTPVRDCLALNPPRKVRDSEEDVFQHSSFHHSGIACSQGLVGSSDAGIQHYIWTVGVAE